MHTRRRQLTIQLVVVSPGKHSGPRAKKINQELQADMATLSTRACQVIAEDSGHGIGNQPELVVNAIRDALLAATGEDRKPGCYSHSPATSDKLGSWKTLTEVEAPPR